ncbi:DUF3888 domain-containing protein [Sporosarcina sp. USHLN248]|uniref:DUF3888 domain-containing protein n=1 Tax=Sporosarcina sp. USHLN248 TaxID=3081300 RepID=UPI00301A0932
MKKLLFVMFLFIICTALPPSTEANQKAIPEKTLQDTLLTALSPYISKAITEYYGYPKSFALYDTEILNIKRESDGGFQFTVEVQVNTFEGPLNPPYGVETIRFDVNSGGIVTLSVSHEGDEEEKQKDAFYDEVIIDISHTFHLNLLPFERYDLPQLQYKAQQHNEYRTLADIAEEIAMTILNPEIKPPYKNVISPVTYIKGDEGLILFKKSDGTNMLFQVKKEDGIWKVSKQKKGKGKKMEYTLPWYM